LSQGFDAGKDKNESHAANGQKLISILHISSDSISG